MIEEEGIVGLDNWPSRFKCPLGFTLQPWQRGGAVSFTPTPGGGGSDMLAVIPEQLMLATYSA